MFPLLFGRVYWATYGFPAVLPDDVMMNTMMELMQRIAALEAIANLACLQIALGQDINPINFCNDLELFLYKDPY